MQKRYVIYSAMVGAYDDILQPKVVDERFDYILFSNDIEEKRVGVWEVRPIMYHNNDNTRICRYVKTHPEELLKEYEVSIWMDANIQITTDYLYGRVLELDEQNVFVSALYHPTRDCIYAEAFTLLLMRLEHEDVIVDWCHKLRMEEYPRNNGLCETGILYRKHNDAKVKRVDNLWWRSIEQYSRRDQLSFNYVLWKSGLPSSLILGKIDVRESKDVRLVVHKDKKQNEQSFKNNEAWLIRHYWKNHDKKDQIENLYYRLYAYPMPRIWVALTGQYYRLIDRIKG